MQAEAKIRELGIQLPTAPRPVATYRTVVQVGNLLYISGHGPRRLDGSMITGKLGADLGLDQGREAARVTGLNILASIRETLGSLDRVTRLVKALGMVNATPDYADHPQVINGFSDLMVEVFGDSGKGARSAVGMGSLPSHIAVEIEAVFEVEASGPPR